PLAPGLNSGGVVSGRGDGAGKKESARDKDNSGEGNGQGSSKGICRYFQSEDGAGTVDLLKKDCKVEKDRGPLKLDGKPEAMGLLKTLQLPAMKALQLEEKGEDAKIPALEVKEEKGGDAKIAALVQKMRR
ncbi:unnamed protein product, partial [Durusdinium trenchii]